MLLLAAEDYSGSTPAGADGRPNYLDAYKDALAANGVGYDVYDIDAMGRRAPHPLGVLGHYDAVIWFTGDDYLTREPGQVPGTGTSRLALDEVVAVRDYLNEGGKVFFAGKHAGQQYFEGFEFRNDGFPQPNESNQGSWCDATCRRRATAASRTRTTSSSTTWGRTSAWAAARWTRRPATSARWPATATRSGRWTWDFGADGAGNQDFASTFVVTQLDPGPGEVPDVRVVAAAGNVGAAGRGAVRSA